MEDKLTYIYSLSDPRCPDNIRYIGKTKKLLEYRLTDHIRESSKLVGTHKRYWIRSLLKENVKPIIELIDAVYDNWEFWERHYISLYKHWGFNLTNSTEGGIGGPILKGDKNPSKRKEVGEKISIALKGHKKSEEHKLKLSLYKGEKHHGYGKPAWNSGKKMSEEYCALFREKNKGKGNPFYGKKHTPSTIEKLRQLNTGKTLSSEHRRKISESGNGKHTGPKSEETKRKLSIAKSKAILQFSLDGEFIKEWKSALIASKTYGSRTGISMCCNGDTKTSRGFIWKFKTKNNNTYEKV